MSPHASPGRSRPSRQAAWAEAPRRRRRELEGSCDPAQLNPFYASKLYRQAEGFSSEELDDAVLRLAELDGALKGQSKLTPDLEVQRTLVALSRRPGAASSS